jgi:hypothetical protein
MQTHGPTPVADHNGEEGRSPEYLIPRKRCRLPPPSIAGNTIPYAATGTGGEAADEDPPSSNAEAAACWSSRKERELGELGLEGVFSLIIWVGDIMRAISKLSC